MTHHSCRAQASACSAMCSICSTCVRTKSGPPRHSHTSHCRPADREQTARASWTVVRAPISMQVADMNSTAAELATEQSSEAAERQQCSAGLPRHARCAIAAWPDYETRVLICRLAHPWREAQTRYKPEGISLLCVWGCSLLICSRQARHSRELRVDCTCVQFVFSPAIGSIARPLNGERFLCAVHWNSRTAAYSDTRAA